MSDPALSDIVTFGEIMFRLATPGQTRIAQAVPGSLHATFAGAEANVAVALAQFGRRSRFVTSLPDNPLTTACLATLRGQGVLVEDCVRRSRGRFGLFFVESGANQRPVRIHYDREGSAVSLADESAYDWSRILAPAGWLHVSGITPAISEPAFRATLAAVRTASGSGIPVSLDVNFRSALWRWDGRNQPRRLAAETLRQLLPHVSVLFAGPGDAELLSVDDLNPGPQAITPGNLGSVHAFARAVVNRDPTVRYVATSVREQRSASDNGYGAVLYDAGSDELLVAPRVEGRAGLWEIHDIVDRVGAGDAFAAGLIDGLSRTPPDLQATLDFATAAGCLAHSTVGDFLYSSRDEVHALVAGQSSGRIQR